MHNYQKFQCVNINSHSKACYASSLFLILEGMCAFEVNHVGNGDGWILFGSGKRSFLLFFLFTSLFHPYFQNFMWNHSNTMLLFLRPWFFFSCTLITWLDNVVWYYDCWIWRWKMVVHPFPTLFLDRIHLLSSKTTAYSLNGLIMPWMARPRFILGLVIIVYYYSGLH